MTTSTITTTTTMTTTMTWWRWRRRRRRQPKMVQDIMIIRSHHVLVKTKLNRASTTHPPELMSGADASSETLILLPHAPLTMWVWAPPVLRWPATLTSKSYAHRLRGGSVALNDSSWCYSGLRRAFEMCWLQWKYVNMDPQSCRSRSVPKMSIVGRRRDCFQASHRCP